MLASSKSLTKIENLHKRGVRFMLDDYKVPTKEYWKNLVNFPWTLKEHINSAMRYIEL